MTDTPSVFATTPQAPDFAAAGQAWADLLANAAAASRLIAEKSMTPGALPYDPAKAAEVMGKLGWSLWSDPARLAEAQLEGWRNWAELCQNTAARAMGQAVDPMIEPARGDRRFKDAGWNEPGFDFARQGYLLAAEWLEALIEGAEVDADTKARALFLTRQYMAAVAPTNSPLANPVVVRRTLETGGLNLLSGASNLLADVAQGEGLIQRRAADDFELGRTIAATAGAVVHQNDLMQLIQYAPTTETVVRRPILMIPPTVNKYYLFDLQPHTSFLKWLTDQGHTVFVISWANPDETHRDKDLTAYVKEGAVAALEAIEQATGERSVDVVGFCLGGTLASITMGYLQATGAADRIHSATLIAALTDFADLGEWSVFLGEKEVGAFAKYLSDKGYVEGSDLARLFSVVRANDLVWAPVRHPLSDGRRGAVIGPAVVVRRRRPDAARLPKDLPAPGHPRQWPDQARRRGHRRRADRPVEGQDAGDRHRHERRPRRQLGRHLQGRRGIRRSDTLPVGWFGPQRRGDQSAGRQQARLLDQ